MNGLRRVRITVRRVDDILRFTRVTARPLEREVKLLREEYPDAKGFEVEVVE